MNVFGALPPQVQQLTVLSVAATGGLVGFDRIMKNLTSTGGKFSNAINSFSTRWSASVLQRRR